MNDIVGFDFVASEAVPASSAFLIPPAVLARVQGRLHDLIVSGASVSETADAIKDEFSERDAVRIARLELMRGDGRNRLTDGTER